MISLQSKGLSRVFFKGFPCGSTGGESPPATWETWVGKVPWRRETQYSGTILAVFYPLQCSGLENSMDYIVHGVAKSCT